MTCECGNCDWTGPEEKLGCEFDNIPDLWQRIEPGGTVPAGECPECGALAYCQEEKVSRVERHAKTKAYTVILILPDFAFADFPATECLQVFGTTPFDAGVNAQKKLHQANPEEFDKPKNLGVIAIFEGHHKDLAAEYWDAREPLPGKKKRGSKP